jgi:hypothetical protein
VVGFRRRGVDEQGDVGGRSGVDDRAVLLYTHTVVRAGDQHHGVHACDSGLDVRLLLQVDATSVQPARTQLRQPMVVAAEGADLTWCHPSRQQRVDQVTAELAGGTEQGNGHGCSSLRK